MARQYWVEPVDPVMVASQTAVTGTAEVAMFPVAPFTTIPANCVRPGHVIRVNAWGVMTTAGAGAGNITITSRWGTSTAGTSLGAAAAIALPLGQTAQPWAFTFHLSVRAVGASGSVVGGGVFFVPGGGASQAVLTGGTVATVNTTTAAGLFFGLTMGSASDSLTTQGAVMEYLN